MRIVSTVVFFAIFIFFEGFKKKNIVLVFLLLITVDSLALFYDSNLWVNKVITIPKALVYFILLRDVLKKLKFKNLTKPISIFFIFIIALNISLVYTIIINSANNFTDNYSRFLILCIGIIIILLCTSAMIYNYRFNSRRSLLYVFITFSFALSDASWFIGYHLDAKGAFYFDISFYLICLSSLIVYALETNNKDDMLIEEDL